MGKRSLLEKEGFRQSLCSVILHPVIELPYNELRVPFPGMTRWNGALDLSGSPSICWQAALRLEGRQEPWLLFSAWNPLGLFVLSVTKHQQSEGIFYSAVPTSLLKTLWGGSSWTHWKSGTISQWCDWCQIKSQVDMVVVTHAGTEDCTVPPIWLSTVWKVLIILFSHWFPKFLWAIPDNGKQDTDIFEMRVLVFI